MSLDLILAIINLVLNIAPAVAAILAIWEFRRHGYLGGTNRHECKLQAFPRDIPELILPSIRTIPRTPTCSLGKYESG
jgi:hypothetical protein